MPPPDPKVMRWFEAWNSTLCAIFYAQLGKADGLEMDEFMLKYNVDPFGENDHPYGESETRMAGLVLVEVLPQKLNVGVTHMCLAVSRIVGESMR